MTCPLHDNPPTSGKCHKCGAIFVPRKRLEEIEVIRNATVGMTCEEIEAWVAMSEGQSHELVVQGESYG